MEKTSLANARNDRELAERGLHELTKAELETVAGGLQNGVYKTSPFDISGTFVHNGESLAY
jgi:hypothetical protein